MAPFQLTEIAAVALNGDVSTLAVPKFKLPAVTLHWLTTVAETERVPVTGVLPAPLTSAGHVANELEQIPVILHRSRRGGNSCRIPRS